MNAHKFDLKALLKMAHSPVRNYIVPGVTSSLIGMPSPAGTMRLFQCERDHQEEVTPHSHRFSFQCWVLQGAVRNRLWQRAHAYDRDADLFRTTFLIYKGSVGEYERAEGFAGPWRYEDKLYHAGECYSMKSHEVHSIHFSRGAIVLFFEGPAETDRSMIIEPFIDGEVVPTFKIEPWMFKREKAQDL